LIRIRRVSSGAHEAQYSTATARSAHMLFRCTGGSVVAGTSSGAARGNVVHYAATVVIVLPPAAVRVGNVATGAAHVLDAATAHALASAACLSRSALSADHASVRASSAALSASLCKTKARAAPTDDTDCDCVIAVAVAVWEGDKYKVDGGAGVAVDLCSGAAVEGVSGAVIAKVTPSVTASVSIEALEPSSRKSSSRVACWVRPGDLRNSGSAGG
jgi:hypothetical protein